MAQPARDATDAERGVESIDHNPVAPEGTNLLMAGGASSDGADRAGDEGESWRTLARYLASSPPPASLRSVAQVAQEQHQGHVLLSSMVFSFLGWCS
jgi:hypothetical protein